MPPMNREIGEHLRLLREESGVDLHSLAARTRIGVRQLKALENGDFEYLSGTVFVRGYIRNICSELNHSPRKLLKMLDETPLEDEPEELPAPTGGARRVLLPVAVASAIFLALLVGSYLLHGGKGEVRPADGNRQGKIAATAGLLPMETDERALSNADAFLYLDLVVNAVEKTWLRISTDGSEPWETTMKPGDVVHLKATESIELLIGNAGGIFFELNGKRFGPPGSHGQVISHYLITRDNL